MRYPLPYAFARGNQLLLEEDAGQLVLWHAAARSWILGVAISRRTAARRRLTPPRGAGHYTK